MQNDAQMSTQLQLDLLPAAFCWTRMGVEAGESLAAIVERKESERQATGGVFLWGIGNAVGAAVLELARRIPEPEVLFSPVKGRPRQVDAKPTRTIIWTTAVTVLGDRYQLPAGTRVMGGLGDRARIPPHYALVCASDEPLQLRERGRLRIAGLANLQSGRRVGASQVTAVVRIAAAATSDGDYPVCLRARLVWPYFLRLLDPVIVSDVRVQTSPLVVA